MFSFFVFVFWIWAPLGMAPEIEERARVPCHGQRIPLRIPKRISWTSRAALGPFHPRRIAPGAYPKRFQKHSPGCKVAWFKHTAPAPTEPPSLNVVFCFLLGSAHTPRRIPPCRNAGHSVAHTPAHRLHFYRQFGAHTPAQTQTSDRNSATRRVYVIDHIEVRAGGSSPGGGVL